MLTRITFALIVCLVSSCESVVPSSQPASRPAEQAGSTSEPSTAPASPEWDAFTRRYEATVTYYRDYGCWGRPATEQQDKRVHAELGRALGGLSALLLRAQITPEELALVEKEVKDMDMLGGRGYRNIRLPGGGVEHRDTFGPGRGLRAYGYLQDRIPELERISVGNTRNPRVLRWLLAKVRKQIAILDIAEQATQADEYNQILHLLERVEDPNATTPLAATVLKEKALSLVVRIEGRR